jgi:protein gp37
MTKIEWTHRKGTKGETWNPIRARNKATGGIGHFCTKVSAGCQNCYAADFQKRFKNTVRYAAQDADKVELFLDETVLMQPLRWKKPRTIFVCSMTDLFYEGHQDQWLDKVFSVMTMCPQHTFIVLTKRPERMREYISLDTSQENIHEILSYEAAVKWGCHEEVEALGGKYFSGQYGEFGMCELPPGYEDVEFDWPLKNVWLGTSVEDQATTDERIPALLDTPATVRFLSIEPLLGPVSFEGRFVDHPDPAYHVNWIEQLDWIIVGGESGHNARPMHPDWARLLRDQCKAAGVPFFFKQWGAWTRNRVEGSYDSRMVWPSKESGIGGVIMTQVGKKAAGRSLDGVEHTEFPEVKS